MARFQLSVFIGTVVVVLSYLGSVGIISNIVTSQLVTCTDASSTGMNVCRNNGYCMPISTGGGYCVCPRNYTGVYCETPLCNPGCWNGGTCVQLSSGGQTCLCNQNFTGPSCEDTATYLSFEKLNYAALETSNRINLVVLRSGDLKKFTSVLLETFDDTAGSGINYEGLSRVLTFSPNMARLMVAVELVHSDLAENGIFWAVLSNSTQGAVQSPYGATLVHVLDTDSITAEVFPLVDPVIAAESDGSVEVEFLRSGPISQNVSISVSTVDDSMDASQPPYFRPLRNKEFMFMSGRHFLRVQVILMDNSIAEHTRFFHLEYSVVGGNGNVQKVQVEIQDDDYGLMEGTLPNENPTYVFFGGTLPYVTNENRGEVTIPIYRIGNLNRSTEIAINVEDGTAERDMDYQANDTSFVMGPGVDVEQVSFPIVRDSIFEEIEEYFLVTLIVLDGGQLGRPQEETVRVNIRPDPREDLLVFLGAGRYDVVESDMLFIEVRREEASGAPSGTINAMTSVEVHTIAETALAGVDFTPYDGEVTFLPGETVKEVGITLTDDSIIEGSEEFRVELSNVVNGYLTDQYSAVVNIEDDDTVVTTMIMTDIPPPGASSSIIPIVVGVIVGVILIFGLALVFLYFYCKRRAAARPKNEESGAGDVPLTTSRKAAHQNSYLNRGYLTPQGQGSIAPISNVHPETREYPRDKLRFYEEIGAGAFAVVYRAEAMGIHRPGLVSTVAVKMLKKTASETDKTDFMKELNVFKMLDRHDNVMSLLGCCTTEEPLYIILDFMPHGNLQSYLQRVRTGKEKDHPGYLDATQRIIQPEEVLLYSSQVARGMEYLASKECIHRDLATRNILLGEDHVCKVSDFGLARDVAGDQQYEMKSKGRVPVRWLAPECLFHNTYTSQSDVWSFGVLMWELVTQGSHPYPGMSSQQVIKQVQHGYRLPKPDCCSQDIYDLMYSCWNEDPEARPTFQSLRKNIEDMLSNAQGYLLMDCFQENDYVYMTPGQESDDEDGLNDTATTGKTDGKDKSTE